MAKVPHEAPLPTRTSVDDVHGGDSNSTKTSEDAGDDATDKDSFCHVLLPPFMMDWKMAFNKMPQRREPLARLL